MNMSNTQNKLFLSLIETRESCYSCGGGILLSTGGGSDQQQRPYS